jgi:anti-anti-sigma factor
MGIRSIVMGAKACRLRGGKLVLLAPADNVEEVLAIAGIDTLVPIYHDIDAAILAVTG